MGLDEARAALRAKYPELTPEDFQKSAGNRDTLAEIVAGKKGISKEEAKKEMTASCSSNLSDLIPIESAAPESDVPTFRKCRPYPIQQQIGTRPSKW